MEERRATGAQCLPVETFEDKESICFTQYFSMSRLNPEKSKEADEEMKLADKACVILIVFVVNLDVQMMFEKHHSRSIFFAYN